MNEREEQQIRCALTGLKIVLVGGDPRPMLIENIQANLGLQKAVHCPTRKTDASSWRFLPKLHISGLALVVCARGLTRTQHGVDLHALCRESRIPLLDCHRLPHPNALVAAIVRARLTPAVLARCAQLTSCVAEVIGGAA
ncbi:MAG: hypothetical protein KF691_04140 [Phycisphaeraceae bacterium]|nr:hypothetical protein [Phycisphaeraceae bacterium]